MSDYDLGRYLREILLCCGCPADYASGAGRERLRLAVRDLTRDVCTCCPATDVHMPHCPKSRYPGVLENGE